MAGQDGPRGDRPGPVLRQGSQGAMKWARSGSSRKRLVRLIARTMLPTMSGFSSLTGHGPLGTVPKEDEVVEYCFEWNREKGRANRAKHGVSFEEAPTVFQDPQMVSVYNGEHSDSEDRWATLGFSAMGRLRLSAILSERRLGVRRPSG